MALGFVALFRTLGYFECDMGGMAVSVAAVAAAATLIESLPINARRVALTLTSFQALSKNPKKPNSYKQQLTTL